MFGLGKFTGVVGKILEFAPMIIDVVERLFGAGQGGNKSAVAAKEVFEFVTELVDNGDEFGGLEAGDIDKVALLKALEDEEVFVAKIVTLNDAIVDLTNYINSFGEEDDQS